MRGCFATVHLLTHVYTLHCMQLMAVHNEWAWVCLFWGEPPVRWSSGVIAYNEGRGLIVDTCINLRLILSSADRAADRGGATVPGRVDLMDKAFFHFLWKCSSGGTIGAPAR